MPERQTHSFGVHRHASEKDNGGAKTATVVLRSSGGNGLRNDLDKVRDAYGLVLHELVSREYPPEDGGMSEQLLAQSVRRSKGSFRDFRLGKTDGSAVPLIVQAVDKYLTPEEPRVVELREAYDAVEEKKWVWRLTHDKLQPGSALRLIRLSAYDSQMQFAQRVGLSDTTVREVENGKRNLHLTSLNQVLEETEFDRRYPKASQVLRLRTEGIEPFAADDMEEISFGEIVKYLRVQRGFSQELLGKAAGNKSFHWISMIEKNRYTGIPDESLGALLEGLAVPKELAEFMQQKARREKPVLTEEQKARLQSEFYYSDDPDHQEEPFPQRDIDLAKWISKARSFRTAFRNLREKIGLSQRDFERAQTYISRIETGRSVPEDYIVAEFAWYLGYTVIDEVTQELLEKAAIDRKKVEHDKKRFAEKKK